MANLTTVVRDALGEELFRMTGRVPAETILVATEDHAERLASALKDRDSWTVTTQRGSIPAKSWEEINGG